MLWARKSKPAKNIEPAPLLIGLDLNSSRARALHGTGQAVPRELALERAGGELPLVVGFEARVPALGSEAARLCRKSPHLVCQDFLAALGSDRQWHAGRHRLDAAQVAALLVQTLKPACKDARGLVMSLPGYLTRPQVALLNPLFEKARLHLLGSVKTPLALALSAYAATPWRGPALVVDIDDHALSAALLTTDGEQIWLQASESWPKLNLRAWKMCLLNAVADRCVRQSRRDPRDCANAEQTLYDQLDRCLVRAKEGKIAELLVQTTQWYQNLFLRPEELDAICRPLVEKVLVQIQAFLAKSDGSARLQRVLVSGAAWRLAGLAPALQTLVDGESPRAAAIPITADDFGEDLLPAGQDLGLVTSVGDEAASRAAYDLAQRIHRGEIPRGHYELSIALAKCDSAVESEKPQQAVRLYAADAEL
jgi:hypothetical protein